MKSRAKNVEERAGWARSSRMGQKKKFCGFFEQINLEALCHLEAVGAAPVTINNHFVLQKTTIRVLGGGGVGEETLLQKGPSPTKHFSPLSHKAFQRNVTEL